MTTTVPQTREFPAHSRPDRYWHTVQDEVLAPTGFLVPAR
jgi:hypothetical protein